MRKKPVEKPPPFDLGVSANKGGFLKDFKIHRGDPMESLGAEGAEKILRYFDRNLVDFY